MVEHHFLTASFAAILLTGCNTPTISSSAIPAESIASLPSVSIVALDGQSYDFQVELAITDMEHAKGLMHRESMAFDHGMLFIFANDSPRTFWMKNTLIPLDMLFISSQGEVLGIIENAAPLTLTGRSIGKPSRYVLELNGGTCKKLGIGTGSFVKLPVISPK